MMLLDCSSLCFEAERDIATLATWTTKGKSKMRVIVVRKKCHNRALDPCFFYYFETETKSMEGLSHAKANIFKEVRQTNNSLKKKEFCVFVAD